MSVVDCSLHQKSIVLILGPSHVNKESFIFYYLTEKKTMIFQLITATNADEKIKQLYETSLSNDEALNRSAANGTKKMETLR